MNNNGTKATWAALAAIAVFSVCRAFGDVAPAPALTPAESESLPYIMLRQILANPGSTLQIIDLCIIAWLIEVTPWVKSTYIPHFTILLGASTYWLFAGTATVARFYPYPWVVLASNGLACGLLAWGAHKQVVHRAIRWLGSPDRAGRQEEADGRAS